jgi:hypothetical protein
MTHQLTEATHRFNLLESMRHSSGVPLAVLLFLLTVVGCASDSAKVTVRGSDVSATPTLGGGLLECGRPGRAPASSPGPLAWSDTTVVGGACGAALDPCRPMEFRPVSYPEKIRVVVHLMQADLKEEEVDRSDEDKRHLLAPVPWALSKYWTPQVVEKFFGCNGMVNQIWERHGIHLSLVGVEECRYPSRETGPTEQRDPSLLRLDEPRRSQLDSIFVPEVPIPWATQLFRSINQLFTDPEPDVLHVLVWWSVAEKAYDKGGAEYKGYSRAAGRGGPAVWIGTNLCVSSDGPDDGMDVDCAKLIAHEIGHALGLHHPQKGGDGKNSTGDVKTPDRNLMSGDYPVCDLEECQKKQAQNEARRRFNVR